MTDYALRLSDEELARYRMMAEVARRDEAELWQLAGIVPGARVADVGCGPAAMTAQLRDVVGPTGSVVGVDRDPVALEAGRALLAAAGVTDVELRQGDADATGLPPGSFDVAVLRHVLAHGAEVQQRIVDHLAVLLRPGGCAYVLDTDLTGMRLLPGDADLLDLADRYVAFQADRGGDPTAGLRLAGLLRSAGLEVVSHTGRYQVVVLPPGARSPAWAAREAMLASGHATDDDVARWQRAWERIDAAAERPTGFFPLFVGIGRRRSG